MRQQLRTSQTFAGGLANDAISVIYDFVRLNRGAFIMSVVIKTAS
jgi:hypothetical protein